MAIALGVHAKAEDTLAGTTIATAAVTTQAAGSAFVIAVLYEGTFVSIVDSKTNSYTLMGSELTYSGTTKIRWYYCQNGTGGATHTATLTISPDGAIREIFFIEITGGATSGILGTGAAAPAGTTDASTPYTSSSVTPATGNVMLLSLIGGDSNSNPATHAATSWTVIDEHTDGSSLWPAAIGYRLVTGDGSTAFNAPWTETGGGTNTHGILIAVFKELAGGGSTTAQARRRRQRTFGTGSY